MPSYDVHFEDVCTALNSVEDMRGERRERGKCSGPRQAKVLVYTAPNSNAGAGTDYKQINVTKTLFLYLVRLMKLVLMDINTLNLHNLCNDCCPRFII